MPELPEVETVARGVHSRIAGRKVKWVKLLRTDIVHGARGSKLAPTIRGRRIEAVVRRGKQVLVRTDLAQLSVVVHLGMTGKLFVAPPNAPIEPHTHLRVGFERFRGELRFVDPRRFGGLWVLDGRAKGTEWVGRRVPPVADDPLEISWPRWRDLLTVRRRQIKPLLLDQEPISGMGNIYCDESLHRAGIHPLQRASELTPEQLRRLYGAVRRVLREAIAAGGSSVDDYRDANNERGWFQTRHRVYGQTGKPCRRCREPIERIVVSGRGTHFCPKCQPLL